MSGDELNQAGIVAEASGPFTERLMVNVWRSEYVESMVYLVLRSSGWKRTETWELWDLEHTTGVKLEVKQSAAAQSWPGPPSKPVFNIAPATSMGRRPAQLYVFAWHGGDRETADHRDPAAWEFYVIPASKLPGQKSITLTGVSRLAAACEIESLADYVREGLNESAMP